MMKKLFSRVLPAFLFVYISGFTVSTRAAEDFGNSLINAANDNDDSIFYNILNDNPALINKKGLFGSTPLMRAVSNQNYSMVNMLLEKGAEVNLQDDAGATALHIAMNDGNIQIIEALLNARRANVNIVDDEGFTPLMKAINKENIDAIRIIMEKKPNLQKKNIYGESAVSLMVSSNNMEIKELSPQKDASSNNETIASQSLEGEEEIIDIGGGKMAIHKSPYSGEEGVDPSLYEKTNKEMKNLNKHHKKRRHKAASIKEDVALSNKETHVRHELSEDDKPMSVLEYLRTYSRCGIQDKSGCPENIRAATKKGQVKEQKKKVDRSLEEEQATNITRDNSGNLNNRAPNLMATKEVKEETVLKKKVSKKAKNATKKVDRSLEEEQADLITRDNSANLANRQIAVPSSPVKNSTPAPSTGRGIEEDAPARITTLNSTNMLVKGK